MALPSDRDDDSKKSQPKEENPFIRFRQFADFQISSLLQGVIGLPSAFSRRTAGTQWDSIAEDLKRRDELQARQKALKDSQAGNKRQHDVEALAISAKKSPAWGSWEKYVTTAEQYAGIEGIKDLPLYSSVTKALFAHLQELHGFKIDWHPSDSPEACHVPNNAPYGIFREQMSMDVMKMTQTAIANDLNRSPFLRSKYSVLPYVLFSPYSPLHLTAEAQKRNSDIRFHNEYLKGPMDTFDYLGAFEDLLRVQSALPRQSWNAFCPRPSYFLPVTPHQAFAGLNTNMGWISKLHFGNVLKEQETRSIPRAQIPWASCEEPGETELDFYEQIAESFESLKKSFPPLKKLSTEIEDNMRSGQGAVDSFIEPFMDDKEQNENSDEDAWSKLHEHVKKLECELTGRRGSTVDFPKRAEEQKNEKGVSPAATSRTFSDADRIASSSTTTTRKVRSDGTIENSITVHKVFADGSSTTTTSERIEDPADKERKTEGDQEEKFQKGEKVEVQEMKNGKGKGWFWN